MTTVSTPIRVGGDGDGSGLQAVLLDMDGTLVDTEDFWWQAEVDLFAELGHRLTAEDRTQVVGGPMTRVIDYLLTRTGAAIRPADLGAQINQRFVDLLAGGVPLMPGAERLLNTLAAHGIPAALVSASHRHIIDIVLHSLGAQNFAFTVAGDEVPRTKPFPDPYLTAAARLSADPARCVVVEDTPTGVAAAEAAGCPVIAVPSIAIIEPGPGRLVLPSLEQVDLDLLRTLAGARV
ncbi:HAD family hydrolase [Kitasatospora sp. NPDC059673]|uniref:HAD family hydrolase n=1 Tax=Kitasatospora sp. NPDC059673 TaxID=3346901 RepID=UPI0036C6D05F